MKNEIIVRFGIWDFDDITHDKLSELLGIKPNKVYIKGERKNPNFSALSKKNGWLLDSPKSKYSSFEDQMNALLDIIESNLDVFKIVCEKYHCEFSCAIFVYHGNDESTPWIHLGSHYNKLNKELNIEFDIDFYISQNE